MYICIYLYICIYVYICKCVCVYVCVCAMYRWICECMRVCVRCVCTLCLCTVRMCACVSVYVHMYVHVVEYVDVYAYVSLQATGDQMTQVYQVLSQIDRPPAAPALPGLSEVMCGNPLAICDGDPGPQMPGIIRAFGSKPSRSTSFSLTPPLPSAAPHVQCVLTAPEPSEQISILEILAYAKEQIDDIKKHGLSPQAPCRKSSGPVKRKRDEALYTDSCNLDIEAYQRVAQEFGPEAIHAMQACARA